MKKIAPAGYSGKPLVEKLGIKEGNKVLAVSAPKNYTQLLAPIPPKVKITSTGNGPFEVIHFFTSDKKMLVAKFGALQKSLAPRGMIWISWPKMSSGIATDLNENIIREIGLALGLVDIKVCAVDETWSGLKFVERRNK